MRKHSIRKEGLRRQAGRIVAVLAVVMMLTGFAASGTVAHAANACAQSEEKREGYATYTLTADCIMHVGPGMMRDAYTDNGNNYIGPFYTHKDDIAGIVFDDPKHTSLPENAGYLFRYHSLQSVEGIGDVNASNTVSIRRMFAGDSNLGGTLDLSGWDTSNIKDASDAFASASLRDGSLVLNLSGWDTSGISDMSGMFSNTAGTILGSDRFDVSHVQNFSRMFSNSRPSQPIDLSSWRTESATDMSYMFQNTDAEKFKGIERLDVANVTDFSFMFSSMSDNTGKAGIIDLSSWNTVSAGKMDYMFASDNLDWFKGIDGLDTSNATSLWGAFRWTSGTAKSIDLTGWDTSKTNDMQYMFAYSSLDPFIGISGLNVSNATNLSGTFDSATASDVLDLSAWDTSSATNMSFMFDSFKGRILGLDRFNTGNAENLSGMFSNTKLPGTLDLSGWDTSHVRNMSFMFRNNEGDFRGISQWDVSNVTDMSSMFSLAKFSTPMDLSEWNVSNVSNMSSMFEGFTANPALDLSVWKPVNATNMRRMFRNMKGGLIVGSAWNASKAEDMSYMFMNTTKPAIDMSGWDTSHVSSMHDMFYGVDMSQVWGLSRLDVGAVTDFSGMFANADVDNLDISGWNKKSSAKDNYMLLLGHFNTITTGTDTAMTAKAFKFDYWEDSVSTPSSEQPCGIYGSSCSIWNHPSSSGSGGNYRPKNTAGTWSQVPADPDDPSSYWTTTGTETDADKELTDRISSGHAGTWVMTRNYTIHFACGRSCTNLPPHAEAIWPVSPDSSRLPDTIPESPNMEFLGWAPSSDTENKDAIIQPGERIPSRIMLSRTQTHDYSMYGKWKRIQRTITYHDDSGDGQGMPQPSIVDSGDGFTLPATAPTRRGYGFVGWRIDGGTTIYQPGARIPEVNSDITLHAVWSAPTSRLPVAGEHADRRLMIAALALLVSAMIAGAFLRMSKHDRRGRHRSGSI